MDPLESWQWLAPEVWGNNIDYDEKSDLYRYELISLTKKFSPFLTLSSFFAVLEFCVGKLAKEWA